MLVIYNKKKRMSKKRTRTPSAPTKKNKKKPKTLNVLGEPQHNVHFTRRKDKPSGFSVNGKGYMGVHRYIGVTTGIEDEDYSHLWDTSGCSRFGRGGGISLDRSITRQIQCVTKLATKEKLNVHSAFKKYIESRKPGDHTPATRILQDMFDMGITPLVSQLPVACLNLGFATAIDLLGLEMSTGKFYVIEIKSGYCNYHLRSNRVMKNKFTGVPNSAYNRHMMQLVFSARAFRETYPRCTLGGGFLVYSCNSRANVTSKVKLSIRNNLFYPIDPKPEMRIF